MTNRDRLCALLAEGGDERIRLDLVTGRNVYGYSTQPRPSDLAMSSSTASTVTAEAFLAVETYYDRHLAGVKPDDDAAIYDRELAGVRTRLLKGLGYDQGSGVEVVIGASGTDIHLFTTALLSQRDHRPLQVITLTGHETGSSVGKAAAQRHFMTTTSGGATVTPGGDISPGHETVHVTLSVRHEDGRLRDAEDVERELEDRLSSAERAGWACLLIVADVSKTGLIAPNLATVMRLRARFQGTLDILIDACQFRISAATLRAYLAHNLMVAVTGSKFFAGPVFSGALLCPPRLSRLFRYVRLPFGLADYTAQADWPEGWAARQGLPWRANFGLLLRWQAALFEIETFLSQSPARVHEVVTAFAQLVRARLRDDPAFEPLEVHALDRSALGLADGDYDNLITLFPFYVTRVGQAGKGPTLLTAGETQWVYAHLAGGGDGTSVRLGQPVACGKRNGVDISAVRLCLSAPLISRACASPEALAGLLGDAMRALDAIGNAARAAPSTWDAAVA